MATWRATLFFQYGHLSWSETVHHADTAAVAGTVLADAKNLARAALSMLGRMDTIDGSPQIPYVRVSDDDTLRDAYVSVDLAGQVSDIVMADPTPCEAWDCLELRGQVENRMRRKIFYFSCIPDVVYRHKDGPFNQNAGAWIDRYSTYIGLLTTKWGLQYRVTNAVDLPIREVTSYLQVGNVLELVDVPYPLGGQRLSLNYGRFGRNSPVIRGLFYTIPSNTANAKIIVPRLTQPVIYLGGSKAQLVRYTVDPLSDVSFVKKAHHKRGGEGGLVRRGRRVRGF